MASEKFLHVSPGLNLVANATTQVTVLGDIDFSSNNGVFNIFDNGGAGSLFSSTTAVTLTNKTIAAAANTISGLTNANLSGSASISNANLASMSTNTIKGSLAGGTPSDLTGTQATTILDVFNSTLKGLVPASGGGTSNFLRADGTFANPSASASVQACYISDQKAAGTAGGTFTSGSWQTRTLNTKVDPNSIATLSSNQFTLQTGTYLIEATAPAFNVSRHQSKIANITTSSDALMGSSELANGANTQTSSRCAGLITVVGATVFELQHHCVNTESSDGFGFPFGIVNGTAEIYSQITITKIA